MTAEVEHISFTLSKKEIKALNKYRKEWPDVDSFEFQLTPTGLGVVIKVRPIDYGEVEWANLTDYGCW